MVYEIARTYVTPEGEKNPGTVGKLAAGAISGAIAQTMTYPAYVQVPIPHLPTYSTSVAARSS